MSTELTKAETKRIEKRANDLDRGIKNWIRGTRESWPAGAAMLYEFQQERAWETLGYATLEAYLADPDVEIERRTFFRLCELHRELVLKQEIEPKRLGQISVSRADVIRPAITSGRMDKEDALSAAEVTPVRDLRDLVKDPDAPIDPDKEPVSCPTCGSRVKAERLNGAQSPPESPTAPDLVVAPERCSCGHTPSRHARYRNPREGEFWGACRTCECEGMAA